MKPLLCFMILFTVFSAVPHTQAQPLISIENNSQFGGKLYYTDYSSGREVSIPIRFVVYTSADNQHLMIDKVYTDPTFEVFELTVLSFVDNDNLVEASFEKGLAKNQRYEIDFISNDELGNWKIIRTTKKKDNNKDARVTITEEVKNGVFTSETRVDYIDTSENENLKRNWIIANKLSG